MSSLHNILANYLVAAEKRVLHAGDDYDYQFTFLQGGVAMDLTGSKVWLTVKRQDTDLDADALLQLDSETGGITLTTPASGVITVHFASGETDDLEGVWNYDIQVKTVADKIITVARGKIEFLANITRATS